MTIQFTTFWNGFADGDVVELSNSDEARHVTQGRAIYVTSRPIIGCIGDSIAGQDYPVPTPGSRFTWLQNSPTNWMNALCLGAFDYLPPDSWSNDVFKNAADGIVLTRELRSGMWGYGGKRLTDEIFPVFRDQLLPRLVYLLNGRKMFLVIQGFTNDIGQGYVYSRIWPAVLSLIDLCLGAGITPIIRTPLPHAGIDNATKAQTWFQIREALLNLAVTRPEIVVSHVSDVYRDFSAAFPQAKAGYTINNDNVHPNAPAAILIAKCDRDALRGRVVFAPPFSIADPRTVLCTLNPSMTGTAGTRGTGANGSAVVPTSWTLQTFADAGSINSTQPTAENNRLTSQVIMSGPTTASDRGGFSASLVGGFSYVAAAGDEYNGTQTLFQIMQDIDVITASNVRGLGPRLRTTGTTQVQMPTWTGDTTFQPNDSPAVRNAPGLLEGERIVMLSFPFVEQAGYSNTLSDIGGCGNIVLNSGGSLVTRVRQAGLYRLAN
jgi:hypothetical protein